MPDTLMREALARLPGLETELEEARRLIAELKLELRIALPYTNQDYTLQGHYLRVTINHLTQFGGTNGTN